MRNTKGQAALEFLTTYGWAFMVILVMIGALSYFGVINPYKLLPDKCIFGTGIGCGDFVAYVDEDAGAGGSQSVIRAQLTNGFGYAITVNSVTLECEGFGSGGTACSCVAASKECGLTDPDATWKADSQREFIYDLESEGLELIESDRPKLVIIIDYKKGGSAYNKKVEGVISVKPYK
ncbi:MAG: hypothetical protein KKG59_03470 [Nanoarchaeota archaeon]|nr:hypothetical protein [Nanoarchaeota archaeon]